MRNSRIANLPNLLTLCRIAATPLFVGMLLADPWYCRSLAVVVFVAASLTDFYDGRVARARREVTEFGRFMDPLADKILVTSAMVALVCGRIVHLWLVAPIVVRDVLITGMRLYGAYHGRQMETSRLAKLKTTTQFAAIVIILVLIGLQSLAGQFHWDGVLAMDDKWIQMVPNGMMAAVLLLTVVSGFHYFLRASFSYNEP